MKTASERLAAAVKVKVVIVASLLWDNLQATEIEPVPTNVPRVVDPITGFEKSSLTHIG